MDVKFLALSLLSVGTSVALSASEPVPVPSSLSPIHPTSEEIVLQRTGEEEVKVLKDGVPVPAQDLHIQIIPQEKATSSLVEDSKKAVPVSESEEAAPPQASNKPSSTILHIQLRELLWLHQIAQEAGGDIEVSIRPLHLTVEDLLVPLVRSKLFEVKKEDKGNAVLVRSKAEDPYLLQLREEVARLERHRQSLLGDLSVLESLQKEAKTEPPKNQDSLPVIRLTP